MDENISEEPRVKRSKGSIISPFVESEKIQELFTKHWHGGEPVKTETIEVRTKPYKICKISNFLKDDKFISRLKDDLRNVDIGKKIMDLYQFEQTEDLANVEESETITELYRTFKYDVKQWMEKNTGISLSGKISMSGSKYSDTHYLLCHDDNMGDRRIAFILYLSDNWTIDDGGSLDIFDTDDNGRPKDVVESFIPEYNSLIFFEVVDNSYHQVAEVKSVDKVRLTINGWFHGQLLESKNQRKLDVLREYFEPIEYDANLLSYVSEIYFLETIAVEIQQAIEKDSFIYLPNFLLSERFEKLSADLENAEIKWKKVGPADSQNYEVADEDSLTPSLKEMCKIFKSSEMFYLLKEYTELDLVPDENMKPRMMIELQRWSAGCYALINANEIIETSNGRAEQERITTDEEMECCDGSKNMPMHENSKRKQARSSKNARTSHTAGKTGSSNNLETKSAKKSNSSTAASGSFESKSRTDRLSNEVVDSDDSSIDDYCSDAESDAEHEPSESDSDSGEFKSGTLDVLLQFHTKNVPEDVTIDYVDPSQTEGALIHVPAQDNHLCIVYRTEGTSRCNEYVNHYCTGYFYTLVCSYYE